MKFQVIGLGSAGMRHAKNLLAMGHEVWGCDPDREALQRAKQSGVNIDGWEEKNDGVIIAPPTNEHAKYLMGAIEHFYMHTFVEKPIASKVDEVNYLLKIAKARKLVVMVGNNLRFNSAVRKAKEVIDSGEIGRPIWASVCLAQYNNKPDYLRDGVLLNWGAHEIDLARYLLGSAKVASCSADDVVADLVLRHDNHHQTHVHLDYLAKHEVRHTLIVGEKENYEFSIKVEDKDYVDEMQAFIGLVNGKPVPEAATGEDGLEVLKLINAAQTMAGLA